MPGDVIHVRLEVKVPDDKCLFRISKQFPHLVFKNISMLPIPDKMGNTLVEVNGVDIPNLLNTLDGESKIIEHEIVFEESDHVLVNIKVREPTLLTLMTTREVMIDYPVVFKDGIATITLIGPRENIDTLLEDLEHRRMRFSIKNIGSPNPREVLSGKQKAVLVKALEKGFFEVPRHISLTDLAKEFGVSPNALSEMIRRLSKRLAMHYMESPSA
ncbi:hypothetical protein GF325_17995 [Candidatus Bathyarchaeota archaeon]|nr:hypothetical protein [Candidatus Bathyarchaeota archaeon]